MGRVEVRTDPRGAGLRTVMIDGQVHGTIDLSDPARLVVDYQARLVDLVIALEPPPGTAVHLGGGAFAIPRALIARAEGAGRPADPQLVVERSAAIITLARKHLGLRPSPGLVVRKADGRAAIRRLDDRSASLVVGDAFDGPDTPRHLSTVDFLQEVSRVLRPGGRYVVNLVDEPPFGGLAAHFAAAAEVFAQVFAIADRGVARLRDPGNVLLVGTDDPVALGPLGHALAVGAHPSAVITDGRLRALGGRAQWDADG